VIEGESNDFSVSGLILKNFYPKLSNMSLAFSRRLEPRTRLPFSQFASAAPRDSPRMLLGRHREVSGLLKQLKKLRMGSEAHGSIVSRKGAKSDQGRSAKASELPLCKARRSGTLVNRSSREHRHERGASKRDRGRFSFHQHRTGYAHEPCAMLPQMLPRT
jgi:hypothetical protein